MNVLEIIPGANWGGTYQPDITSYDYDAPLSEAGDPTPKYYAIRNALEKVTFLPNYVFQAFRVFYFRN